MADGFQPQSIDTDLATTMRQPQSEMRKAIKEIGAASTATTSTAGTVKKAAAVTAIATPGSADAPTTAAKVNELIAALKTAGVVS